MPKLRPGSFQEETLALLGIARSEIEEVGPREAVRCEELYAVNAFDLWRTSPYCRLAAEALAAAVAPASGPIAGGERLYLPWTGGPRRVANMAELAPLLVRHGFTVVGFEPDRLAEQIRRIRQARLVIAEQGPALTSLVFARAGTRVLELTNQAMVQPMNWSIAACAGLGYGYLIGRHSPSAAHPVPHAAAEFAVPPDLLEQAILAMEAG